MRNQASYVLHKKRTEKDERARINLGYSNAKPYEHLDAVTTVICRTKRKMLSRDVERKE